MAAVAYIDSSALLKLVARERETQALEAHLATLEGLVVSRLAVVECLRAIRRAERRAALQTLENVLEAVYLLDMPHALLEAAGAADPPELRSLEAIHLASALSIHDPQLEMITYDRRLADASRAAGLIVRQPGA